MPRALFVFLIVFCAAWAPAARAQDEAVVVGLRYQEAIARTPPYYAGRADSLSRSAYYTLLLVREDETYRLAGENEGLLIPRPSRFVRVQSKRSVYNDWVEDFLYAAPVGETPRLPGIQAFNGEYCEGTRAQRIEYAGTDYLSVEQHSAGYCEGASHPWVFNTLSVVPIDSTDDIGLNISDVLGEAGHAALEDGAAAYLDSLRETADEIPFLSEPDEANWGLVRREGRWVVRGRLEGATEATPGQYADFPVAIALPPRLAGRNSLAVPWEQVRRFAPDAIDALTAPDSTTMVIVRPTRLTVHRLAGGTIRPDTLSVRLRAQAHLVMARWLSGQAASTWVERFSHAPARSPSTTSGR